MTDQSRFYVTGGSLPADAPSYVERRTDTELYDGLRQGEFCYVLTPRQMGKSSLMVRTATRLRAEGITAVVLDFTAIGQNLGAEQWYYGLLDILGEQLGLESALDEYWAQHTQLGPLQRFMSAIREVVLGTIGTEDTKDGRWTTQAPQPPIMGESADGVAEIESRKSEIRNPKSIVIFMDEIDVVRGLPFHCDELFAAIRECYNHRTQDPELHRLTFCLMGVAAPTDLIRDTRLTPFNIGRRIELSDFSADEATLLAKGLRTGEGEKGRRGDTELDQPPHLHTSTLLLNRILYWTGGHPYLTQRLCLSVRDEIVDNQLLIVNSQLVDHICLDLFLSHRAEEKDDNLTFVRERMLRNEADLAALLELYRGILNGKRVRDDDTNALVAVLRLSGIARVSGGLLHVRNLIYERVFNRQWVRSHMPDAEIRRQRSAYRRGVTRATAVSVGVLAVVGALGLVLLRSELRARVLAEERSKALVDLRRNLYSAQMTVAYEAAESGNLKRARDLLLLQRPGPNHEDLRGFEWRYAWGLAQEGSVFTDASILPGNRVSAVTISPDGKTLATGGSIALWDLAGRRRIHTFLPDMTCKSIAFSPDGQTLAGNGWAAKEGTHLWNVATRGFIGSLTFAVQGVAFSPDGRSIATNSSDGRVRIWDAGSRQVVATAPSKAGFDYVHPGGIAYSPNGTLVASSYEAGAAQVWEPSLTRLIASLDDWGGYAVVAFSPDGRILAGSGMDNTVRLWDTRARRELPPLHGHRNVVTSAAFSRDGRRLATGGGDNVVKLWDTATWKEINTLRGHSGWVLGVAFSRDGKELVTGGMDGALKVWNIADTRESEVLYGYNGWNHCITYSPDGRLIAAGGINHRVRIWNPATGDEVGELKGHTGLIRSVEFSSTNPQRIITGSPDKTVRIWDAKSRKQTALYSGVQEGVEFVRFSPDGSQFAVVGDERVSIRRIADGGLFLQVPCGPNMITCIAYSPDGRLLAVSTGGGPNKIWLWDIKQGSLLKEFRNRDFSNGIAFSPGGRFLACASDSGQVKICDVTARTEIKNLQASGSAMVALAFSPDGKTLATGGMDKTVTLWSTLTWQQVGTIRQPGFVNALAFSPDGRVLACGLSDHTIRLVRAESLAAIDSELRTASSRDRN